jgi:hypothetical protein
MVLSYDPCSRPGSAPVLRIQGLLNPYGMCSPIKTSVKPIFSIFAAKARSAKAPRHSPRPCGIARQQLSRKLLVDREVGDGEASIRPEDTTDLGQDSKSTSPARSRFATTRGLTTSGWDVGSSAPGCSCSWPTATSGC